MIRVWSDNQRAGVLERLPPRGSTFAYEPLSDPRRAVSVTMPVRVQSWDDTSGLLPIFEMNLPEGALREHLTRRFAKATGRFDDFDLLGIVGRSQIGRIRYSAMDRNLAEEVPFQSIDEILRARRDGGLFDYLLEQFASHSGLSGVQPKVMIRATGKVSDPKGRQSLNVMSATHIVKLWKEDEFAELAGNEFFCLQVARRLGLSVPNFVLSDDGGALVLDRFDLVDGRYLGFEDFCVLNALGTADKYKGGYETRVFRRLRELAVPAEAEAAGSLEDLFRLFLLNCAIRNGDAHLKNFGIVYEHVDGPAKLAPIYDLVTTWAYLPNDPMALTLDGSTRWPDRKSLIRLARTRADLSESKVAAHMEATADAMASVVPQVRTYFASQRSEIGARMLEAWEAGVRDSLGLIRGLTPVPGPAPPARRKLAKSDEKLLAYLRRKGGSTSDALAGIAGGLGMPESTLSASLDRLIRRGLVQRSGRKITLVSREI
jgi:serine/threonine-protein kinase HipA